MTLRSKVKHKLKKPQILIYLKTNLNIIYLFIINVYIYYLHKPQIKNNIRDWASLQFIIQ